MESSKEEYKDFQSFLEQRDIIPMLRKAVAKDRLLQPTTLQKKLIPIIQEGQKHILVKYEEQSGLKLGLYLPIVNSIIENKQEEILVVLCYSKERINELQEFFRNLIKFREEAVRIQGITKSKEINTEALPNILITNPKVFLSLAKNEELKSLIIALVVDQVDRQLLLGFEEDIKAVAKEFGEESKVRIIITVKETEDTDEAVKAIKNEFMPSALIIRFRQPISSIDEKFVHYYYTCNEDEKFLLLFALIKLNTIYGKTIIKVENLYEGYKVKIFLNRIGVTAQVLNAEMPTNTQRNTLQSFNSAHFDYLIIQGTEKNLRVQNVRNIIFFTITGNYGEYSKVTNCVSFQEGYIITMLKEEEEDKLQRLQEKQKSHLGGVLFLELPVKKRILESFAYRIRDAIKSVTPKAIKAEKARELKKVILGSKKLKTYFEEHPQEKEILTKQLTKNKIDERRFASLKILPDYLIPKESLLANPVEMRITEETKEPLETADRNPLPVFSNEEPVNYEDLPPTSGRKLWKLRHNRRIKKKPFVKNLNFVP